MGRDIPAQIIGFSRFEGLLQSMSKSNSHKRFTLDSGVKALIFALTPLLIITPIGVLFVGTFNSRPPGQGWDFTFQNYIDSASAWVGSIVVNSILVAIGAALFATLLGAILAFLVVRTNVPFRDLLGSLIIVPYFLSPFIGALAWTMLGSPKVGILNSFTQALFGLERPLINIYSYAGIIWVLGLFLCPLSFLNISASLKYIDPALEESSNILGAGKLKTFRKIVIPLVMPSVTSSFLLCFILSVENFGVPTILGAPAQISLMTSKIWEVLSLWPPDYNRAATLAMYLLAITAFCVFLQRRVVGRKQFVTVTGKGYRPSTIDLGKARYLGLVFCLAYVFVAVVLPNAVLILGAFSRYWTPHIAFDLLTLENIKFILFDYDMTGVAIKNSLLVAGGGACVGILFCLLVAHLVQRSKIRFAGALEFIAMAPLGIPGIVMGFALLWTFLMFPVGLYGTLYIIGLAYIIRYMPYGLRVVSSTLMQIHEELEESSRVLGGGWLYTLRKITIPILKYGVLGGWMLLFIAFFRELSASILLYTSGTEVFSVAIFEMWSEGYYSYVCTLGLIQIIVVFVMLYTVQKISKTETF
jgi:iron(III) transport system permease protein